jgi:predicted PurR-regulated permease PerM
MFLPFLNSIILGFVLWAIFNPLFEKINKFIKIKTINKTIKADIVLFLINLLIFSNNGLKIAHKTNPKIIEFKKGKNMKKIKTRKKDIKNNNTFLF